jgi:hypothetical protein
VVPDDLAELAMEVIDRVRAVDRHELVDAVAHVTLRLLEDRIAGRLSDSPSRGARNPAVLEARNSRRRALHERRGAQAVGAVVAEVGLADREQARHGGLGL